ncbi:MAG: SIS domain-containing protein [Candidatus Lokiarchaeota archaeon]|nr:SIS domain-containing protein [Candidatus Lokiarchaeota archaeon]MBD3342031.1 SIS domain-containing protein [Candidatus Lokiarchaeota archaeon]
MNEKAIIARFVDTMREITEKVSENIEVIERNAILQLIDLILDLNDANARVFVYGAGRSGFIGRCFAQRLMHLGINSCFVSDAVTHQYTKNDGVIIISGSGETTSPVAIAKKARDIGGKIVLLTGNPQSTIGNISDLIIQIKGKSKDKATSQRTLAPYTSLFDISTLAVLDSIGGILMEILEVTEADIDMHHATIE